MTVSAGVVFIIAIIIMKLHKGWDLPQMAFGVIARDAFRGTVLDGIIASAEKMFMDLVKALAGLFNGHGSEGALVPHLHAVLVAHGLVG